MDIYKFKRDSVHETISGPDIGEWELAYCIPEEERPTVESMCRWMNKAYEAGYKKCAENEGN